MENERTRRAHHANSRQPSLPESGDTAKLSERQRVKGRLPIYLRRLRGVRGVLGNLSFSLFQGRLHPVVFNPSAYFRLPYEKTLYIFLSLSLLALVTILITLFNVRLIIADPTAHS